MNEVNETQTETPAPKPRKSRDFAAHPVPPKSWENPNSRAALKRIAEARKKDRTKIEIYLPTEIAKLMAERYQNVHAKEVASKVRHTEQTSRGEVYAAVLRKGLGLT